jgi:SNF2 family DNA or RNA helicase
MPATAELEFDEARQAAVLYADLKALSKDSTFRAYVRAEGGVTGEGEIAFPTAHDALHQRFQELLELLGRHDVELRVRGEAQQAIRQVEADEIAFADFSAQAAAIWRGSVDAEALAAYARVVANEVPGRGLYPLQLLSSFHLAFAQNACNFSVPGAGKTTIVLAAFAYLKALPQDDPKHVDHLLVVGPLASFKAWKDEFRTCFGRPARMRRIAGFTPMHERRNYLRGLEHEDEPTDLTVTTYATLASTPEDFARFLGLPNRRTMVVLDEAHNIKRGDGARAAAALALAPHAGARVVLTGTPAPNGYEDLSNLFRFLYPYRDIVGFPPTALRAMTEGTMPAGVDTLKSRLQPYYTRIRKSDLRLAPARFIPEPVGMSPLHAEIYSGVERLIMPELRSAGGTPSSLVRARLMRLRQAAVNPALLLRPLEDEGLYGPDGDAFSPSEFEIAEKVAVFDPPRDLVRLQRAVELAREVVAEQGKLVVWSYFLGNLRLLRDALASEASFVELLTGTTPVQADGYADDDVEDAEDIDPATREAIIDRFHNPRETAILIANPQAVGESISLHKSARTAIYFDRDFNAGRFIQSKDRIHRYDPKPLGEVRYHLLAADGTVDDAIARRLIEKEARLADLVDSVDIPLFGLADPDSGEEDIRAVLRDYERRKAF